MKAVKLYEPGNLQVEEIEVPEIGADEVLVEVKAVGVCGSDIPRALYKGAYYQGLTLGHEFSGQIAKVGVNVTGWQAGDRVSVAPLIPCNSCTYCRQGDYSLCEDYSYYGSRTDGAMAHFIKVTPDNLVRLGDQVSYEAGAMIDPAANAIHGLWRGDCKEGDTVAVFGLGAIGLFAIQFAKVLGAKQVIAVDIHEEKLELAKELGADIVVNSMKCDPAKEINAQVGGADFILDTSGSPIAQNQAVCAAAKQGRIVFLGISNSELTLSKEAVNNVLRYELALYGSWNSFSNPFPGREWSFTAELMAAGKLKAEPLISHRYALEQAPDVFQKIKNRELIFNKIMFFPK
ncbi:galactitol-1-phosphate 5-dehydrogenase [Brevibacillus fluminis]|uniref:Galactitol-1-phosphate 5-dehydrogenase n=1 Tax=Brevibacillus fluminis TaxID=511487 RepID=A0A3M8DQX2_9BACL|nr:galactitol-1-phosphate 5-dehydrogenase [Brevibacillus fluminis]RNB89851.1 galactitol-1-phosphate 5-dehydrogenase [Brevibacillus fluminis]